MLIKKFPVPCRVDYVPSLYEPDEDGVQDVGYYNVPIAWNAGVWTIC